MAYHIYIKDEEYPLVSGNISLICSPQHDEHHGDDIVRLRLKSSSRLLEDGEFANDNPIAESFDRRFLHVKHDKIARIEKVNAEDPGDTHESLIRKLFTDRRDETINDVSNLELNASYLVEPVIDEAFPYQVTVIDRIANIDQVLVQTPDGHQMLIGFEGHAWTRICTRTMPQARR